MRMVVEETDEQRVKVAVPSLPVRGVVAHGRDEVIEPLTDACLQRGDDLAVARLVQRLRLPVVVTNQENIALKLAPQSTGTARKVLEIGPLQRPSAAFLGLAHKDVARRQINALQQRARADEEVQCAVAKGVLHRLANLCRHG